MKKLLCKILGHECAVYKEINGTDNLQIEWIKCIRCKKEFFSDNRMHGFTEMTDGVRDIFIGLIADVQLKKNHL